MNPYLIIAVLLGSLFVWAFNEGNTHADVNMKRIVQWRK